MRYKRQRIIGVYAILNIITGEMYIGSSRVDIAHRIDCHVYSMRKGHKQLRIKEAVDKYGLEAFAFVIIEECLQEICRERETFWMETFLPEYNFILNGMNSKGYKHRPETKAKMSNAQIGNQKFKGHHLSEEAKRIIGTKTTIRQLGTKDSEEVRKHKSEANKQGWIKRRENYANSKFKKSITR